MIQRIKTFLLKNSILFLCTFFGIIVILLVIIFGIFLPKKTFKKIEDKVTNTIDTVHEKIIDLDIKKETLEISKKIKEEKVDTKKYNLEKNLEIINSIPDREKRIKSLIEFNKTIKVLK